MQPTAENILAHSAAIGGTLSTSKAIFTNREYSNRRSTQYLMGSAFEHLHHSTLARGVVMAEPGTREGHM
ncbi:hypothetical protein N657DRAFT_325430 [Parathielavia appendiculata]|uniref:Uncharacterized protein n=1 Tax=Parathielavia appendiculata TaxID=2587402 RepID=A0AAN6TQN2_9PEZI|nr:hypothetical protein N657DRAFT_325430 [Parathielavia appendiculata]